MKRFRRIWQQLCATARLAVGVPDYETYVRHMRQAHPGASPMDRDTFFRERMGSRYGRGRSRCC